MLDAVSALERVVDRLSPTKRRVIEGMLAPQLNAVWKPDERNKPQMQAFYSKADLLLYGGGRD